MEIIKRPYIKTSLHSISPYIGKLRPEIANFLINKYSRENDTIYDPFCGSGTILLESWINNRTPIGTDLNFYAYVLSKAKLNPYYSYEIAIKKYEKYLSDIKKQECISISEIPQWVKDFFHPKTLKEILSWTKILLEKKDWFFLSCLMGILHHQRPGFLSYPSSHGAPYLRADKFPKDSFPDLYEYRNVGDRLLSKIERTYKYIPELDFSMIRSVHHSNAITNKKIKNKKITIITSPPYMKSLTYARDNRLRLWFLNCHEWKTLDKNISIGKNDFLSLITKCFTKWSVLQETDQYCILVIVALVSKINLH